MDGTSSAELLGGRDLLAHLDAHLSLLLIRVGREHVDRSHRSRGSRGSKGEGMSEVEGELDRRKWRAVTEVN